MNFKPGLLFNFRDILLLVAGVAIALSLFPQASRMSLVTAMIIGHIFVFSNVFRISHSREFIWSGCFVLIGSVTIISGSAGWLYTIIMMLLICIFAVGINMQKPSYHGVFWRRVNPQLEHWWTQEFNRYQTRAR